MNCLWAVASIEHMYYSHHLAPMDPSLGEFTHLDAIGIMAAAHLQLQQDPRCTLRELSEAGRILKKAEDYQFSLTVKHFDFSCFDEP